ncbi:MAG: HEAT repeat domain-containing protein [Anaerolineales bacterium]|nr:HEAT repeat domain-containing protein [Anaerolineales bacterium]
MNLLPGETRLVIPVTILALLLGSAHVLARIVGNTLFLIRYGAEGIPYIYICAGVLTPISGLLLTRLAKRIRPSHLLAYSLGLSLLVLVGLRIILNQQPATVEGAAGIVGLVLFIWVYIQSTLTSLGVKALTDRLLDARQHRRMSNLINGSEVSGRILGGVGTALLATLLVSGSSFSISDILIFAAIATAGALIPLAYLSPHPAISAPIQPSSSHPRSPQDFHPAESISGKSLPPSLTEINLGILKTRYVQLLIALTLFALVGYFFVDQIFQYQIINIISTPRRLMIFFGLFEALLSTATLVGRVTVGRPIIHRFGILAGLLALPVITTFGVLPLAAAGLFWQNGLVIFWLAVMTKFIMVVFRRGIEHPAEHILFQPLPDKDRSQAQAFMRVVAEPGSAALAGILLLVLPGKATLLAFVLAAILVLWVLAAVFIGQEYHSKLTHAVNQRSLGSTGFSTADASSLAVLARGLESPNPGSVLYILDILEQANHPILQESLIRLLNHPVPEVRQDVLTRIEHLALSGSREDIEKLQGVIHTHLQSETSPAVKGMALRALAALSENELLDELATYFDHPDVEVRSGALIGMLRSGGLEGALEAGDTLLELAYSSEPAHRIQAAKILGEIGVSNFYRPILRLLRDPDYKVRQAALAASGKLKNSRLWPFVIQSLDATNQLAAARLALLEGGPSVLPFIEFALQAGYLSKRARIHLAEICGKIGAIPEARQKATTLLLNYLEEPEPDVRLAVLRSLSACGYHAGRRETARLEMLAQQEVQQATWRLAAQADLPNQPPYHLAYSTLGSQYHRHCEQVVLLLSFLYEAPPLLDAWKAIHTRARDINAQSLLLDRLEDSIPAEAGRMLLPLLDNLPIEERLRRLHHISPQRTLGVIPRLEELLFSNDPTITPWLKATILWALEQLDPALHRTHIQELQQLSDPWTTETLALVAPQGGSKMLSRIEKVLILRNVYIFNDTPDEVLTEIVAALQETTVKPGQKILHQGDMGQSLYIIIDGQLRVHDESDMDSSLAENKQNEAGGGRTFAYRQAGDVIGEMSILDGLPISASVTATQETRLLCLDQEHFFDLMADRIEIARGIIRMLAQRLRALMAKTASISGQQGLVDTEAESTSYRIVSL